jgi:hypothetical protein
MLIIKFFSSFSSSEGCIEAYTRVSELLKDPAFKLPKSKVLGLAFEPLEFLNLTPEFVAYAEKHIGTYLIGKKLHLPSPFVEHFSYMWHLTPLDILPQKTKCMSLMISNKRITTGHNYRHTLCKLILNSHLPIDIYGTGCVYYKQILDTRLKGNFQEQEPYEDYLFHIAIENVETPHYFSEKIMNPLLCNTIPIYLGCNQIDQYFPKMVIKLTGQAETDFALLKDICLNQERYIKPIDITKVKKTIHFSNIVDFLTP